MFQSVGAVAKSVLNLAHEEQVLKQGLLHLDEVLKHLEPLHKPLEPPGGSVLLHELVSAPVLAEATSNPQVYSIYSLKHIWKISSLPPPPTHTHYHNGLYLYTR